MSRIDLIQLRGGTAAQWTTANPILAAREPGLETDTQKVKYGNGTDHWADLPYASGGSETDGVGAVFFGGVGIAVPFTNTNVFCPFLVSDDPPRAPQRDDLMVIDPDDDTKINVVRSGLYDIALNTPVKLNNVVFGSEPVDLRGDVQVYINDGNEPAAYDFNNRAYWRVTESGTQYEVALNIAFPQVLLVGDVVQLKFNVIASPPDSGVTGTMGLDPDITFLLTYRGPVTL